MSGCWTCDYGHTAPLPDARPLRLVRGQLGGVRFIVRPRDHARKKPEPCRCTEAPHPFCWVVTCRCDHGIGAR